jgi:peptidyl-prolyl cis-trans isomerase B (cyclophilin B)
MVRALEGKLVAEAVLRRAVMALHGTWRNWVIAGAALMGAGLVGCNKSDATVEPVKAEDHSPAIDLPPDFGSAAAAETKLDPKLHQPFEEACTNEIPANSPLALPPDVTATGKKCGVLHDAVFNLWDQVKFAAPDGRPQTFVAELEVAGGNTPLGTIEMVMQPELAPNHVRNFVALATLGYYDGLHFDRIVKQQGQSEDGKLTQLVLVEAGSPIDPPDTSRSHLGYWVKPEFNEAVKHEEGTVGACLLECEDNAETAAVRFYITLTRAPAMDGNFTTFAKVTKGLDVVRRIAEQPVMARDPGPEQGRPVSPIIIKKVTVRAVPVQ